MSDIKGITKIDFRCRPIRSNSYSGSSTLYPKQS